MLEFKRGPTREHDVAVIKDGRVIGRIRRVSQWKAWQVDVEGDRPSQRTADDIGVYDDLRQAKARVERHFGYRS
jgi:hypothetical protein